MIDRRAVLSGIGAVLVARGAAAMLTAKVLDGAKPADLPVEQPVRFRFVLNLATAQALVLAPPSTLLARADDVVR